MIEINTETKEQETTQVKTTDLDPRIQKAFDDINHKESAITAKKGLKGMEIYIVIIIIILLLYFIVKVISAP